jgi:hypothetical protein
MNKINGSLFDLSGHKSLLVLIVGILGMLLLIGRAYSTQRSSDFDSVKATSEVRKTQMRNDMEIFPKLYKCDDSIIDDERSLTTLQKKIDLKKAEYIRKHGSSQEKWSKTVVDKYSIEMKLLNNQKSNLILTYNNKVTEHKRLFGSIRNPSAFTDKMTKIKNYDFK